jgi:hypothetical protein
MAANPAAAGDAPAADTPEQQQQQQPQGSSAKGRAAETAAAAAAAAVANVDLPMVLLEATSAVSAYVDSPSQAATVSKFIRHLNTLAEMHAKASVGDRAKQQQLRNVALGVSAGLPHLLLFMKTMSGSGAPGRQQPQQEEEEWAEVEERSSGLTRSSSVESFESAVSASSSSFSSSHAARPGHHQAAALAIEWATARARYASSSGRQQLLSCSALQLSALAGWLVLAQQQPVSEEAVGPLQPLAMGPGLQLQLLSDVMSLVTNPDAQLPGLDAGSRQLSGGSSRGSSIHQGSISTEQAAATAVAAAAALAAGADAGG